MKTYISQIGVLDKRGQSHVVTLKEGLNIITGKSSTGKSAVIEIFDYCMGSENNTIPVGVITEVASVYFSVLNINEQIVVIARKPEIPERVFYKKVRAQDSIIISGDFFDNKDFIEGKAFKKILRDHFIDIDDVDTSTEAREKRGQKAPTPSIRSFVSFMLQHQNLVANKHALFYRFDQKEKRDQVIEHTKNFLGFVDQQYYILEQEKENLQARERVLNLEIERNKKIIENQKNQIEPVLKSLYAAAGIEEVPITIDRVLLHPSNAKEILQQFIVPEKIKPLSNANTKLQIELEKNLASNTAEWRSLQRKKLSIKKSIEDADKFSNLFNTQSAIEKTQISHSSCPFCNAENDTLTENAELLSDAIHQLNDDLSSSPKMKSKLQSALSETDRNIEELKSDIKELTNQLETVTGQNEDLKKQKTLYETVLKQKVRLDFLLDLVSVSDIQEKEKELRRVQKDIKLINQKLQEYDLENKMIKANKDINDLMKKIGENFDFEEGYKPINLHFSLETFDLYHLREDGEKVYLRSMGSGANWLYSHMTLFLALHWYFAWLGNKCAIPSVLFLDQPTQVYFPSFKFDKNEEFAVDDIEKVEKRSADDRKVDEDMLAVQNLFSQLSIYCKKAKEKIGIVPQIIVTDHADHLTLSDGSDFENYVNGNRWRTRGLIEPVNEGIIPGT